LQNKLPIYQAASDTKNAIKVIIFFTLKEKEKAVKILAKLNISDNKDVVLIDARSDNKPSGSIA
jgi:hypothetical protein